MNFFRRLFASPKHPYIPGRKERETISINLSGSILTLQLPPHTNGCGNPERKPPVAVNIFDEDAYSNGDSLLEWQQAGVGALGVMRRNLGFLPPPWGGFPYGNMTFSVGIGRMNVMPQEMSLFNPKHLEQAEIRNHYFHGPAKPMHKQMQGPVNWRIKETSESGTWIYSEQHPILQNISSEEELPREATDISCVLTMPLSHRCCVSVSCHNLGFAPVEECLKQMNEIWLSVLDSVELDLSDSAKQQLKEAQEKWPNAKASKNRDPEPWVYPEVRWGDIYKNEPEIVILKAGTPPPTFTP